VDRSPTWSIRSTHGTTERVSAPVTKRASSCHWGDHARPISARRDERRLLQVVHELRTPLAVAMMNLELASATRPSVRRDPGAAAPRDRPHGPHGRRPVRTRSPLAAGRTPRPTSPEAHTLASEHAASASTRVCASTSSHRSAPGGGRCAAFGVQSATCSCQPHRLQTITWAA
jgi:signal transduction histidine kinase